jgi:hypothetical protein
MKITFNNGMEMEITEAPAQREPKYVVPSNHQQAYAALTSAPPPPNDKFPSVKEWTPFIEKYTEWWNTSRAVALR